MWKSLSAPLRFRLFVGPSLLLFLRQLPHLISNELCGLFLCWPQDSYGCTEMCGAGSHFIHEHQKWQGLQTLAREVGKAGSAESVEALSVGL